MVEEDDEEDFVAPSRKKTPVKPPPSKKSKVESSVEASGKTVHVDEDEEDRMDEDVKTVRVYLVGYIFCIIDYHICQDIFGRLYILYNRLLYMSGYIW
jgi:hypothetical protein